MCVVRRCKEERGSQVQNSLILPIRQRSPCFSTNVHREQASHAGCVHLRECFHSHTHTRAHTHTHRWRWDPAQLATKHEQLTTCAAKMPASALGNCPHFCIHRSGSDVRC
eukprot:83276-Pelagomonas_calceolata.AAC.1